MGGEPPFLAAAANLLVGSTLDVAQKNERKRMSTDLLRCLAAAAGLFAFVFVVVERLSSFREPDDDDDDSTIGLLLTV